MSNRAFISAFVAIVIASTTTAQYACPSIPLCCQQVVNGPSITPAVSNVTTSLDISNAEVIFPVGISCVPIRDPPAEYILLVVCSESPKKQVCCAENNWGGKIAFGCFPDPPIETAK
ncbi:hypothetical protein BJ138DRAFT_1163137 [Hygrophoropsis aurantiaca]|uniref:Uncharacterized protein n=1 Tax=Hygrophoropsis aurantiaca TaxID=72124 RepID=A0ACB7ZYN3_9AGAM|nr:hypothetical protein BJ138DRAFT_1163137 [Hygrophoropsis aurantiaca]